MPQIENFSRCVTDVLVPAGDIVINDEFSTGQPNFNEFFYAAVNGAGAEPASTATACSRGSTRAAATSRPAPEPEHPGAERLPRHQPGRAHDRDPAGPRRSSRPFRGDVACHTNAVPDVNGIAAAVGPASPAVTP